MSVGCKCMPLSFAELVPQSIISPIAKLSPAEDSVAAQPLRVGLHNYWVLAAVTQSKLEDFVYK